jgi:2',3'-cyclic-nucleotide 2'-phosphodiesterase/3'-nucleotidase/5'-nucleotidase
MKTATFILIIILVLSLLSGFIPSCQAAPCQTEYAVTILHTNDTHAHLENVSRYCNKVIELRDSVGEDNTLLLHSGDVFAGTPYYLEYHGQADLWFMNYLKYDAMCLGNHEFDDGVDTLADFVTKAEFPILCANFDFSKEQRLAKVVIPNTIITRSELDYGIFGLTTKETKSMSSPGPNIVINDHIAAAKEAVTYFEKKGIDNVIALTHIGWDVDIELAKLVEGIDVIVGGHSHTVPNKYPTLIAEDDTPTLVVQAGCFDQYIGQLNVAFDKKGVVRDWTSSQLIPIDDKITEDAASAAKLAEYNKPLEQLLSTIIGKTLVELDSARERIRVKETNLGNLITDAMLRKAGCVNARIALINSGSVRKSIPVGDVSLWQAMQALPFNNYLESVDLTGKQIIDALENSVSQVEEVKGRFLQVAGLRFTWNPDNPPGERVGKVEIGTPDNYEPIEPESTYCVATTDYIIQGGDDYTVMNDGTNKENLGFMLYEVLAEYIKSNSPVNPAVEGRIKRISEK